MKRKLQTYSYYIMSLLCSLYIISSIFLQLTCYNFNSNNVKKTIETLTSKQYAGRLTGSDESTAASLFIEEQFKNFNLKPFDNESFRESFDVITPVRNDNIPSLLITSNGKIIHNYEYGRDFKENMLSFKSSEAVFSSFDNVEILTDSIIITRDDKKYLFKVNINKDFSFRSSFNSNSQYEFCINITTELFNDILDSLRNHCNVYVKIPYTTSVKPAYNVIGMIKGTSNSKPPLILSAHYDHLGIDALGNYYNGALDNASGTAFLLELSKTFSSLIKPERDIVFVALTGEEFGLLGSKDFVSKHSDMIENADVINFDMIGASNVPITFMLGLSCKDCDIVQSNELLETLKSFCEKEHIEFNIKYQNSSDHASFNNAGIHAFTICHSDTSKIHTPNDNISYIDSEAIDKVYKIVEKAVYSSSYNRYFLILYNPLITFGVVIIFLLCVIIKNYKDIYSKYWKDK